MTVVRDQLRWCSHAIAPGVYLEKLLIANC